jgi:hypothetical protein
MVNNKNLSNERFVPDTLQNVIHLSLIEIGTHNISGDRQ